MAVHDQWQYSPAHEGKLFVLFSLLISVSATCAPAPIPIRIGNVTLSTNQVARGLDISVGSPQQPFAFLPQWPLNNTFVYGTSGFCETGISSTACTTFRGGSYSQLDSTTRGVARTGLYLADASPYPTCNWVTENVTLSSNVTLGNFPIGIAQADWGAQGYFPQMALGLGPNSTVLNALKSTGQIASRSWGMFWGQTGATSATQLEGNFVLGGYDRAKIIGPNYTQSLTTAKTSCPTNVLVTITDMVLNFANGTNTSLFGKSAVLAACVVPTYPVLITIPTTPYFNTFQSLTQGDITGRSFGIYYYGMLYDATGAGSTPYDGDLTITLSSGLSVRIPNNQLVVPNLTIDSTSGALTANASSPELVLNAIQQVNAGDLPQLGRQFLTAAYLMVNQDTSSFTLWEANPTKKVDLVAVDTTDVIVDNFCGADSGASTTTSTSAPASTTSAPATVEKSSSKISTGAIAGIAIGSIAGISALAGILIVLWVKRRRGGESARPHLSVKREQKSSPDNITPTYVPQDTHKSELSGVEMTHETDGAPIAYPRAYGPMGAHELPS